GRGEGVVVDVAVGEVDRRAGDRVALERGPAFAQPDFLPGGVVGAEEGELGFDGGHGIERYPVRGPWRCLLIAGGSSPSPAPGPVHRPACPSSGSSSSGAP